MLKGRHDDAGGTGCPTAGVLSSGGTRPVWARVYVHPVPQIVPASLSDVLDPVYDISGAVADWRVSPAKLLDREGRSSLTEPVEAFRSWRRGYVVERHLGDVATVRSFLAWAQPLTDMSSALALLRGEVRIDPATATRVASQTRAAGVLCRSRGDEGVAVAVAEQQGSAVHGLVRGFVAHEEPTVVLASGTTQINVSASGLQLVRPVAAGSPGQGLRLADAGGSETVAVRGWTLGPAGVDVRTAAGSLHLGDDPAARLLVQIAPGVTAAQVRTVPLTSVFAELLVNLPEMALNAAYSAKALVISSSPAR